MKVIKKYCKHSKARYGNTGNPWWNKECSKVIEKKKILRKNIKKKPDKINKKRYRESVRNCRIVIRRAKRTHWNKVYENADLNDLFKHFKKLKKERTQILGIKSEGKIFYDYKTISNKIGKFFSMCGKKEKYRHIAIRTRNGKEIKNYKNLMDEKISEEEIKNVINKLNNKKHLVQTIYRVLQKFCYTYIWFNILNKSTY